MYLENIIDKQKLLDQVKKLNTWLQINMNEEKIINGSYIRRTAKCWLK